MSEPDPPPPPGAPPPPPPVASAPASAPTSAPAVPRVPLDDRERALDPRIVQVWRAGLALGLVLPFLGPAIAVPIVVGWWGLLVTLVLVAAFAALVAWWPRAKYRRWRWQLTTLAVELRHGVIVHRHQAVPYFRVQQIDVTQGPLDRLLGLATLMVTTASSSGSAALPGIPADEAPGLRTELLARAAAAVGEHEGDLRDAV